MLVRRCLGSDTSSSDWYGYIYPTIARDGTSAGSRNNRVALACHQCCVT